jgi:hypothetical protein
MIAKTPILCCILRMARLDRLCPILIQNLQGTPGVSILIYRWMVSKLTALIVLVMPYNLPPNKCLEEGFIFLTLVIPSPKELKKQMNIFLHPLIEELKELWQGVDAYDSHPKCRFNLRVAYIWSIHDYLAYGKFVG